MASSGATNPAWLVSNQTQRTEHVKAGPTLGALTCEHGVSRLDELPGLVALVSIGAGC